MDKHYKLFTARQLLALTTFSDLVTEAREVLLRNESKNDCTDEYKQRTHEVSYLSAYADAVATYLACCVSAISDDLTSIVTWRSGHGTGATRSTFARQAIPMIWDFAEANPLANAAGDIASASEAIARVIDCAPAGTAGIAEQLDATATLAIAKACISTDPPYYDNIGYADLSVFFYIWLRRSLRSVYPSLFATLLTPKSQELIASPFRHDGCKDRSQAFFEEGLDKVFVRMRAAQNADFPLTIFYAFKQSETEEEDADEQSNDAATASMSWETLLSGLVRSGFCVTGTWPMRTERGVRSVGLGTNALASSIVLVCRPRQVHATMATRKEYMNALRQELPEALRSLQQRNIAPVDLAQASIGPGMSVFTRYAKVIESDGSPMTVRTALGIINQVLDEVLAEQEGEFDADTRWALAWFEQYGAQEGTFGDAETFCKARNTAINGLVEAGVVKAMAENARDLAYRLYSICERKKWAEEALAYNGLDIVWPGLSNLARAKTTRTVQTQRELFEHRRTS